MLDGLAAASVAPLILLDANAWVAEAILNSFEGRSQQTFSLPELPIRVDLRRKRPFQMCAM